MIVFADFVSRRVIDRCAEETREERARRIVLERCKSLGVPDAQAKYQANLCAQIVRAGHEPSTAAERAVRRALEACRPTNTDPNTPFAA